MTMNKVNKPFVSMLAIEILIHSTQDFLIINVILIIVHKSTQISKQNYGKITCK